MHRQRAHLRYGRGHGQSLVFLGRVRTRKRKTMAADFAQERGGASDEADAFDSGGYENITGRASFAAKSMSKACAIAE